MTNFIDFYLHAKTSLLIHPSLSKFFQNVSRVLLKSFGEPFLQRLIKICPQKRKNL